jgi:ABC-type uncharacterized transport system involved in gliding motility auxiliary subunit
MRVLRAIVRREVGAFFHSNMAPVLLGGFLIIVGLLFTKLMISYSDLSTSALQSARSGNYVNVAESLFRPLVSTMLIFVVLLMPSLSMRVFSPEYGSGRYNLLASWPVPDHIWVLGKWWAAVISASVMLLSTMAFFASVWFFDQPEFGPLFTVFLGLLLLASCLLAWGTLASVSFKHQILAYFVTMVLGMFLFMVHLLERFLPGMLGQIAEEMSLMVHFERFSRGVLDTRDITYFLMMTMVPLTAATAVLAARRLPVRRHSGQWLSPLLAVGLAVVIYILVQYLPTTWDLTGNKRYSLAPQTVKILKNLEEDLDSIDGAEKVNVYAFYQRIDPAYDLTEVLLKSCRQQSRNFQYRMVDPEIELEMVRKYGISVARTIVIEVGEWSTTVLQPEESALINAVYRLVKAKRPVIGHLQGHGEHRLDSTEMAGYASGEMVLQDQGYDIRHLNLSETGGVPQSVDVVIIAGPRIDPTPAETQALDQHLAKGKAVLALFDPNTTEAWSDWIARYRVRLTGDVFITSSGQGSISRMLEVIDGYGEHEISVSLKGVRTLFPFAQPLEVIDDQESEIVGAILMVSNEVTWAESDPMTRFGGQAGFDKDVDTAGPLPVALVLESPSAVEGGAPGRMVVVGNSEFLNNNMIHRDANRDLLLNIIGWLAREEGLIELRGRDPLSQPIILTRNQKNLIQWGSMVLWPLFVVSVSVGIMIRHRRRSQEES